MRLHQLLDEIMNECALITGHNNNLISIILPAKVIQEFSNHFLPAGSTNKNTMTVSKFHTSSGTVELNPKESNVSGQT
jgi:hypothetical protein